MSGRNATVTFARLVDRQIAEAFLPSCIQRVPNKSKLVELLPPRLRQSFRVFALALPIHPRTEAKAIFFMALRNATMTFALLVDRQIAEAFLPLRFGSVPNKSKLVELLSPRLRQNLRSLAPIAYPLPKGKAIFFMSVRGAAYSPIDQDESHFPYGYGERDSDLRAPCRSSGSGSLPPSPFRKCPKQIQARRVAVVEPQAEFPGLCFGAA